MMEKLFVLLAFLAATSFGAPAFAQDAAGSDNKRKLIGVGWLFSDDLIGDDHDRWRSAALAISWATARNWNGTLPSQFGDVIEYRAYTEMITSEDLVNPSPTDRPYAGILGFGVHTHFSRQSLEYSLGAELVAVGPQTNVDSLQRSFHRLIGSTVPAGAELEQQIENDYYPTLVAEAGRNFDLGRNVSVRPFGEVRIGDESLMRIGADMTIGQVGRTGLLIRDKGTGQRYRVSQDGPTGFSLVLGADYAYVHDTAYIPSDRGLTFDDSRLRVRFGGRWQGKKVSIFYGAVHLSEEFETQRQSQVVGSFNLKFRF